MGGDGSTKRDELKERDVPGLESILEVKLQDLLKKRGPAAIRPRFARLIGENVV